jgi:hypothetical protein
MLCYGAAISIDDACGEAWDYTYLIRTRGLENAQVQHESALLPPC